MASLKDALAGIPFSTHDIVTVIGAITVTIVVLKNPEINAEVLLGIAGAYTVLNGGQAVGMLGQGGKRMMQGGVVAPDRIVAPVPNQSASTGEIQ